MQHFFLFGIFYVLKVPLTRTSSDYLIRSMPLY